MFLALSLNIMNEGDILILVNLIKKIKIVTKFRKIETTKRFVSNMNAINKKNKEIKQ